MEEQYEITQGRVAQECGGPTNVNDWYEMGEPRSDCAYYVGESFLLAVHNALGEQVVSSSMREIYLLGKSNPLRVAEDLIYQAFLSNTPPGRHDDFRVIYGRLHGGPVP